MYSIYDLIFNSPEQISVLAYHINHNLQIILEYDNGSDEFPMYRYITQNNNSTIEFELIGDDETEQMNAKKLAREYGLQIIFVDENIDAQWHEEYIDALKNKISFLSIIQQGWIDSNRNYYLSQNAARNSTP